MRCFRSLPLVAALVAFPAMTAVLATPASSSAQTGSCVFTVSMLSGTDVNNLDFTVNYSGAAGEVQGSGSHADCVNGLGGSNLFAVNDNDNGVLKVAQARLSHFSGPVTVAACRFLYDSLEPAADSFV